VESRRSRPHDAVYLHFLDRELNEAAGRPMAPQDAIRHIRLLLLLTQAELYCGLSAIWENGRLGPISFENVELVLTAKQLQIVSGDLTTSEFLDARRAAYDHDQSRYPRYFTDASEGMRWSHPTWQKVGGTTKMLVSSLRDWAENPVPSGRYTPTVLAVHEPVRRALERREWQAVTYSFFRPHLGKLEESPVARNVIRRQISAGFTLDYMRHGGGDIATGISELSYFDKLAVDFPYFDGPILGELASIVGLSRIADPVETTVSEWQKFVFARTSLPSQLAAGAARWIIRALYEHEMDRPPPRGQDASYYYDQRQVRARMVRVIREAARVTERLLSPGREVPAEEAFQRVFQRLRWLAERLGNNDTLLKARLDEARGEFGMAIADIIVTTVNDAETDALVAVMEGAGYRGRPEMGSVNSYWLYGPINGAMVAHVRSSMGSGGQGGSALTLIDAIRDLRPGAVIGVGVAFGVDEDTQPIGQLLVSEKLTEYERARVGTGSDNGPLVLHRGTITEASPRLVSRFRDARLADLGISVRVGDLLSGEKLIDNPDFKEALMKRFPDAIGGEMEGAGVQAASGRENKEWLVVKAVCDYASNKSFDKVARQQKAARTAAKALLYVLERGGMMARRS
jgi:nucleoside phosphorylase